MTNVIGSAKQRNMAANCKCDMIRRQGGSNIGIGRFVFGPERSAFFDSGNSPPMV
jgi:hypothetical protein